MLSMANLSLGFWMEAVYTAMHIINRSPSMPLDFQIPEQLWLGKEPHYNHLRVLAVRHMHMCERSFNPSLIQSHTNAFLFAMV